MFTIFPKHDVPNMAHHGLCLGIIRSGDGGGGRLIVILSMNPLLGLSIPVSNFVLIILPFPFWSSKSSDIAGINHLLVIMIILFSILIFISS